MNHENGPQWDDVDPAGEYPKPKHPMHDPEIPQHLPHEAWHQMDPKRHGRIKPQASDADGMVVVEHDDD